MHSALSKWPSIQKAIEKSAMVYLFLDYDGTLTPIAPKPEEALLSPDTRHLLQELGRGQDRKVAIVSGRSLSDIKDMVGLKKLIYVGNHGYEIEGDDLKFNNLTTPNLRIVFNNIREEFDRRARNIKGAWIEDKRATLSIHYRQVDEKKVPELKRIVNTLLRPRLQRKEVLRGQGKKVVEVRPPFAWDKGKAVLWLLRQQEFAAPLKDILPIYIGDDITDEDAFTALRKKGITVSVGEARQASRAQYKLKDTEEVAIFLTKILHAGKGEVYVS